jgi:NTE family protein
MDQQSLYPTRPHSYDKKVALVLQGGGALGSYQAGVYEALSASEYPLDWVAGISIGAINAAIIAGNEPGKRVERLLAFWEKITASPSPLPLLPLLAANGACRASSINAMMFGQTGFFTPRAPHHWMFGARPVSYYDTRSLKSTLEELVDFDRINRREIRFSVAAVNVRTGNFVYFDNAEMAIAPEHIMASAALPPAFPAIEIEGEFYWDGGLVSNTPLQRIVEGIPRRSSLIFQVDLFAASGPNPIDLAGVGEREKDIRYSSKSRALTEILRATHDVRHNINKLWDQLPAALRDQPEAKFLYNFGCVTTMDIVELIYRPADPQGFAKDYDFSRAAMRDRWSEGLRDARATLLASPWLTPMPPELGARTFDVLKARSKTVPAG